MNQNFLDRQERIMRMQMREAEKAVKLLQPHIDTLSKQAQYIDKRLKPYVSMATRVAEQIKPYVLRSSHVYFVDWPSINKAQQQSVEAKTGDEKSPLTEVPATRRLGMGVFLVAGNSFKHKTKNLKAITMGSKQGRLLNLLLSNKLHFITDERAFNELAIDDARNLSFVVRNLRQAFRKNELDITIEDRKNPDGYILIDIKKQG